MMMNQGAAMGMQMGMQMGMGMNMMGMQNQNLFYFTGNSLSLNSRL